MSVLNNKIDLELEESIIDKNKSIMSVLNNKIDLELEESIIDKNKSIMSVLNNKIDLELEESIIDKNKSIMSELNPIEKKIETDFIKLSMSILQEDKESMTLSKTPIEKKIEVDLSKPAMSKNEADKMSNRLTQLKEHLRKMDIMRNKGIYLDDDERLDIVAEITKIEQKLAENTLKNTEKDTTSHKIERQNLLPNMSINSSAISNITMSVINFGNFAVGDYVDLDYDNHKGATALTKGLINKITEKTITIGGFRYNKKDILRLEKKNETDLSNTIISTITETEMPKQKMMTKNEMYDKIWELPNDEFFVIKKDDIPTDYCIEDLVDNYNDRNDEAQVDMDTDENGDVNIVKVEVEEEEEEEEEDNDEPLNWAEVKEREQKAKEQEEEEESEEEEEEEEEESEEEEEEEERRGGEYCCRD
jgi:hypothetical protein